MLGRSLNLTTGEPLEILSPGKLNTDAGPDFSCARLRIGDMEWVGDVEIHIKASDWYRHGHDKDAAYDSVLLHVVAVDDAKVKHRDGTEIPQVIATFPESFFRMYATLSEGISEVRCEHRLAEIPLLVKADCCESLGVERMQRKADRILEEANQAGGDWERVCFITFSRALGFGLNSEPFEMLARSLPLAYLHRHSDNLMQLEALMFGQAGMLDMSVHIFDEYYQTLCREYYFLARKYNLRPMRRDLWRYARTRPQNFPHRRIALLARTVYGGFSLMSRLLQAAGNVEQLRELLPKEIDGYWLNHFAFDSPAITASRALSESSVDLLLINFVAPLVYAYGAYHSEPEDAERGLELWNRISPESNMFIRYWKSKGMKADNAFESQALLQLRKEYCDMFKCLDCRFGHWLLSSTVRPNSCKLEKFS